MHEVAGSAGRRRGMSKGYGRVTGEAFIELVNAVVGGLEWRTVGVIGVGVMSLVLGGRLMCGCCGIRIFK